MGFSTEGKGETNNPVGINVGVEAGGEDKDTSQAEINVEMVMNIMVACETRCLFLIFSPLSTNSIEDGSTSPLKRQAAHSIFLPEYKKVTREDSAFSHNQRSLRNNSAPSAPRQAHTDPEVKS